MKAKTMTRTSTSRSTSRPGRRLLGAGLIAAATVSLGACKHSNEHDGHVAGWSIIDPTQRHPIIVSSQPTKLAVLVTRDTHGLSPQQRAQVVDFLGRYRAQGSQGSRVVVSVPSGAPNEVAAMHGLAEIRQLAQGAGFDDGMVKVEPYHDDRDNAPPIRISYASYVAEGPQCGNWSSNVARSSDNLAYPNFGCAQQRNLAAMISNPADLLGPRTLDGRPAERRDAQWDKFRKGESTGAQKGEDEKVKVKGE